MGKRITRAARHERIQRVLEANGRFDCDYIPFGKRWVTPDGSYRYRLHFIQRVGAFFVRLLMATVGVLLIKLRYGVKVEGKEHLRAVKDMGAIAVCNHFSCLDILLHRYATGYFRSYVTVAPQNNKRGLGGALMRRAGTLPFSNHLAAMRNFWRESERLLKRGKMLCFYAEQAMWVGYQKPRPMKEGAFYFAVKYNVPVVPVFCTFQKSKRGAIKRVCVRLSPAVFPNEKRGKGARISEMRMCAQAAWGGCYEEAYGAPPVYEKKELSV